MEYLHADALGSGGGGDGCQSERREYEPYGSQLTPAVTTGPGYTGHVRDRK